MRWTHYWTCLKLAAVLILFALPAHAGLPVDRYSTKFDDHFRKYSKRYFSVAIDWKWFKAQAITESALNPRAVSPVGAMGVMQIMPGTWSDIMKKETWIINDVWEPRWNIAAGIYYDRWLWNIWKADRPLQERLKFVFGSYNCGAGNVLKAQKRCVSNCNQWASVMGHVPHESYNYVIRIFKLMGIPCCG
jgi:soluble lytic murein transglycosylase-like protein